MADVERREFAVHVDVWSSECWTVWAASAEEAAEAYETCELGAVVEMDVQVAEVEEAD
jgi:hypothetical protein